MSRLIDNLTAELTGQKYAIDEPCSKHLSVEIELCDEPLPVQRQVKELYKIDIHFGMHISCLPEDKRHMMEYVVKEYKNHAFDEVRNILNDLDLAIYSYDLEKARELIKTMRREIY